jgi:hypothetical protein
MLLLLPLLVLIAGLFILIFSNLRRPLRSSWLVAVGTAGVALLTLIFLRFRLPASLSYEGWWVGESLEFSAPLLLDPASWILAFAVTALLLSSLLNEVSHAMTAKWALWARGLALSAAVLFATFSGDLLAFAFALTVLDLVLFVLILSEPSDWQRSRESAVRLIANLVGNMLLLGAWALPDFEGDAIAVLILTAAALRLGLVLRPQPASPKTGMMDLFRLAPFAAALALLTRAQPMSLAALIAVQLFLLLPAAYSAWKHLSTKDDAAVYWTSGFGTLALAAAAQGSALAVLAFGIVLLFGEALLNAAQTFAGRRFALVGAVVGVSLLSGLPFAASFPASDFYANPGSFVAYAFLPIQALLLLGWARRAAVYVAHQRPLESWMQTVQIIALVCMPIVFILFGLGAAPSFPPDDFAFAWWWAAIALALVALLAFLTPRTRFRAPVAAAAESVASLGWLNAIGRRGFAGLTAALAFISSILEGPAGVLWALLLIALLLSVVAQAGLGA